MNRMKMLMLLAIASFLYFPESHAADGKIHFYVYHLNEADTVATSDAKKVSHLFRSRDSEAIRPIDPRLIALIDQIEDHFGVHQVEIISGFRSQAFNRELKETGHHVAGESLHIQGMAADIHLDEITEEALRDYALSLKKGGVGFYPSLHMVHVDVGPVRTWGEPGPRKSWVGEKNSSVPLTLTVSPDRSLTKRLDYLTVSQEDPHRGITIAPEVVIEFFSGTQWKSTAEIKLPGVDCSKKTPRSQVIPLAETEKILNGLSFGKYRLRATTCDHNVQYSNEFYFKKE